MSWNAGSKRPPATLGPWSGSPTLAFPKPGDADRAGDSARRKAEVDRIMDGYREVLAIDVTTINLRTRCPAAPNR